MGVPLIRALLFGDFGNSPAGNYLGLWKLHPAVASFGEWGPYLVCLGRLLGGQGYL